ncbi:MAG: hypothetical protein MUF12_00365 [Sediminibacterium sp.]|jgi:hypothetical protein|nr:hypothetical protein [Hydrotalea sp.]MCU0336289.1 hypothetical protein [Sediminibacterium sp.]
MVTEAQHQAILQECQDWYKTLVQYKEKIQHLKNELYLFAPGITDHDTLVEVEHYHNQFHIQLINLHDVKHEIRHHVVEAERHPNFGHRIPHHQIKEKLDFLLKDLDQLENNFHNFIQA